MTFAQSSTKAAKRRHGIVVGIDGFPTSHQPLVRLIQN